MKKLALLLFIILITSLSYGQGCSAGNCDVVVQVQGNVPTVLEQDRNWNNAIINNYIITPPVSYSVINLFIRNKSASNSRAFTVLIAETSDPSVVGFNSSNCGASHNVACSQFWTTQTAASVSNCKSPIAPASTETCSIFIRNSRQISIQFQPGGGAAAGDKYDLILNFNVNNNSGIAQLFGIGLPTDSPQVIRPYTALSGIDSAGNTGIPTELGLIDANLKCNGVLCVENNLAIQGAAGGNVRFDGTTQNTSDSALMVEKGPRWGLNNVSASGSQATATHAPSAGCGSFCIVVLDCVSFSTSATAAVASTNVVIDVDDGTSTLWSLNVNIPTTAGVGPGIAPFQVCGLALPSQGLGRSLTCKFSAGVTGAIESINCSGYEAL